MGSLVDKLYKLDCENDPMDRLQWRQLEAVTCGINIKGMCTSNESGEMYWEGPIQGINVKQATELSFCEGYLAGKMHRKPFPAVGMHTESISDVYGPMHTESIGGEKYFVTFTDDDTQCCAVCFMKHK